jgi:hypothetical protein
MTVTQQPTIAAPPVAEAWALYADTFAEVNELAAQRHLMTLDEFVDVYHNPNVRKFFAYDGGELVGMSVLTNKLDEWPLISPRYFARRWPEQYEREAIWYIGFVGVTPNHSHSFRDLIRQMYAYVISNNGMGVMDFCTYNLVDRRLGEVTHKLLSHINRDASMEVVDAQTTVLYRFDLPQGGA